ncbi:MAG: metallophosphoesterase family protein [Bryobacter sp.]|nr:metallophosphoesterase family protein [Bryobacter sp.]
MRLVEIGEGRLVHASGALWLAEPRALLVADLHLGFAWAQRRKGELGPLLGGDVSARLLETVEELSPEEVVLLGDVVHAPRPLEEERHFVERVLQQIGGRARLIVVRGNHDRAFARDFGHLGFPVVTEWRSGNLRAVHGDRLPSLTEDEHVVLGHYHPVVGIRDAAGAKRKVRAVLAGAQATVLPSFSPFAAGSDSARYVIPALRLLLGPRPVRIAVTGNQALPVNASAPARSRARHPRQSPDR